MAISTSPYHPSRFLAQRFEHGAGGLAAGGYYAGTRQPGPHRFTG
jgi:hypothetical protein